MRKVLLSFLIGCLGFISGHASTSVSQDWQPSPIQEGNVGNTNTGRHRTITLLIRYTKVDYDPDLSALLIYTPYVEGHVFAVLQNSIFGTPRKYDLTVGAVTVIPINNTFGTEVQRLTICLRASNPICYFDVLFYIDDGELYWKEVE